MSTWARTSSGDMYLPPNGQGSQAIVTDPSLAMQIKIPSVIKMVKGEWVLNLNEGFPWPAIWAQKAPNQDGVRLQLRKTLLAIPNVASVQDLASVFTPVVRNFAYNGAVTLVDGTVVPFPGAP